MAELETIDVDWLDEPVPHMPEIRGRKATIRRLYRRLNTKRGRFPWWQNDGLDVKDFLLSKQSESFIASAIQRECEKDEGVDEAQVTVTRTGSQLTVNIRVFDSEGPFAFTLSVTDARVALVGFPDAG